MKIRLFKHNKCPFVPANNCLYLGETLHNERISGMNLIINGTGNVIRIHPKTKFNIQCNIHIHGDNNVITFEQSSIDKCNIAIFASSCKLS